MSGLFLLGSVSIRRLGSLLGESGLRLALEVVSIGLLFSGELCLRGEIGLVPFFLLLYFDLDLVTGGVYLSAFTGLVDLSTGAG